VQKLTEPKLSVAKNLKTMSVYVEQT
jgi:hypothetical protein